MPLIANTPNNLSNVAHSHWASLRNIKLYQKANASDVDSVSTCRYGTEGELQEKGEGNF
jgi:hypothetical protein